MITSNLKPKPLASETYVQNQIEANLPTGTVTSIEIGDGLSLTGPSGDFLTVSGKISLDALLGDLNDVTETPPLNNEVLTWSDTESKWCPRTFTGLGTGPLNTQNIENINPLTGQHYSLARVNSSGEKIEFVTNQLVYAPNFISGRALSHTSSSTNDGATLRVDVDLSQVVTTTSSDKTDTFVIVDSAGNQRRIEAGDYTLENFQNPLSNLFIRNNDINATGPIHYNSATQTFTLTNERYNIDFNIGTQTGVLPIEHGGTNASTASEAREKLGLQLHVDVMAVTGPHFKNTMKGADILIRPSHVSGAGIGATGTGYPSGPNAVTSKGVTFSVDLTTGMSGEIIGVSTPSTPEGAETVLDWPSITGAVGPTGTDGVIDIFPSTGYINFGQTTGHGGYGIGYDGEFWFRKHGMSDWQNNIPFRIEQAIDVSNSPPGTGGMILVWDDLGHYTPRQMSGDGTLDAGGRFTLVSGAVDPSFITATHDSLPVSLTPEQMGTLSGIHTGRTIQEQLANAVSISPTGTDGDMIYYDGSKWKSLEYPPTAKKVITSKGISAPSWNYISDTYDTGLYTENDRLLYVEGGGPSVTYYSSFRDILDPHTSGTGGIHMVNTDLSTDLSRLSEEQNFVPNNFSMVVNNDTSADIDKKISVTNFVEGIAGKSLQTGPGGTLDFVLENYSGTGDLPSSGQTGELVFVQDTGSGICALGCWSGTSWLKISFDGAF